MSLRYGKATSISGDIVNNLKRPLDRQNLIAENYEALSTTLKKATTLNKNATSEATRREIGTEDLNRFIKLISNNVGFHKMRPIRNWLTTQPSMI